MSRCRLKCEYIVRYQSIAAHSICPARNCTHRAGRKHSLFSQRSQPRIRFIYQRMLDAALMSDIPRAVDDSFDQVVCQREAQVLRVAYRILGNWADAEDVAQEVFVRLYRRGLKFPNDAARGGWLYRVTSNLCLDRLRSSRTSQELPELRCQELSAEASAIREEQKQRVMTALATLPAKERAAVVLREIEGLSTAEVAKILGSTEGTVRSQVAKALARLRTIVAQEE